MWVGSQYSRGMRRGSDSGRQIVIRSRFYPTEQSDHAEHSLLGQGQDIPGQPRAELELIKEAK